MRSLWTLRWMFVHVGVLVLVAVFLALGWWQVGRAASGNLLSYGYAVQWPAFAAFVVYVWIKEMRRAYPKRVTSRSDAADSPTSTHRRRVPPRLVRAAPAYDDRDDPELAAYNRYLEWLNANPHASPSDYPGRT